MNQQLNGIVNPKTLRNQRRRARRRANRIANTQALMFQNANFRRQPGVYRQRGTGRAARRRRNRQRKNAMVLSGRGGPVGGGSFQNRFFNPLNLSVPEMEGVSKLTQTLFFPEHGVHRGLAASSQKTAVCTILGSIDINKVVSSTPFCSFRITPGAVGTTTPLIVGKYAAAITDPTVTPDATLTVPHPFSTVNPSTDFRCISFECRLIPSGALTSQSGEGVITYNTNIAAVTWDNAGLTNSDYMLPFNGVTSLIAHWVPNQDETGMNSANAEPVANNSCIAGYIAVPPASASASTWRLDYTVSYEYVPSSSYRMYVERLPPTLSITSYFHLNKLEQELWNPLILGYYEDWMNHKMLFDPLEGTKAVRTMNQFGLSAGNAMVNDEEVKDEVGYGTLATIGGVATGALRYGGRALSAVGGLLRYRQNRVQAIGAGGYYNPSMPMMPDPYG